MSESMDKVLGPVELIVRDIAAVMRFYTQCIGLKVLRTDAKAVHLGAGGNELLVLHDLPDAKNPGRTAGLYHVAILLPSRRALALQLRHLVDSGVRLQGAADHLVSEALYLSDPEGNGIEIYYDRPPEQWPREKGQLRMASDPLDFRALRAELNFENIAWAGLPPEAIIGHVHLRVSDLSAAETFYREVLRMNVTVRYGHSAIFLSYKGYHHHIGINTWESLGVPAAPVGSPGLRHIVLHAPDMATWKRIESESRRRNIPMAHADTGLKIYDPSGNAVLALPP